MKKRDIVFLAFVLSFFVFPFASAEIVIGPGPSLYNLGDSLNFNITLNPTSSMSDFLLARLVCGSGDIELFKSPYTVKSTESKTVFVTAPLDSLLVRNLGGFCYLEATYGGETVQSSHFEISRAVDVTFHADSVLDPGKDVIISGTATKRTGFPLEGIVEASIEDLNITASGLTTGGTYALTLTIPSKARAGLYNLVVRAFDKDSLNALSNLGSATQPVRVKQIITGIDLALDKTEVSPNQNLTYTILLYDQTGELAKQECDVSLLAPDGSIAERNLLITNGPYTFYANNSALPGQWNIVARYGGFEAKKAFTLSSLENLTFSLINNELVVYNTGNVPINRTVKINIGNISESKAVVLGVGKSQKFSLSAPDGVYQVAATFGDAAYPLGSTYLTGNAVDVSNGNSGSKFSFWIWVVLLLILFAIVLYFYIRSTRDKKSYYGKSPSVGKSSLGSVKFVRSNLINKKQHDGHYQDYTSSASTPRLPARPLPVIAPRETNLHPGIPLTGGNKQQVALVCLKIANYAELADSGSNAPALLDRLSSHARTLKAKIQQEGSSYLFIFAPLFTKEKDNSLRAIKFAKNCERVLTDYNKKNALRIEYGLGANIGEMLLEKQDGRDLKFIALNNTSVAAKRAAERSKGELIITHALHHVSIKQVRGEPLAGENFWRVSSLADRSEHEDFIARFMQRQQK